MKNCFLVLANGSMFAGTRFGADAEAIGELVFTTAAQYMGTLTDPCYAGQIVLQTSPLAGNYGIIPSEMDSDRCHLFGYVVKEWCDEPENFKSVGNIDSFLKSQGIAGVCGVDTRQITRILREEGTMRAAIVDEVTPELLGALRTPPSAIPYPAAAAKDHPANTSERGTIAFLNCGAPHSAIRALTDRGFAVREVPYTASLDEIMAIDPSAVVIGDGPGDPASAPPELINLIRTLSKRLPVLGLGLGHLLMARAMGGATEKLHHGHRGANHPIRRTSDGRVFICSLNQGYFAKAPMGVAISYEHINSSTAAGFDYGKSMSVQFIPDAMPIALGTDFIYDEFLKRVVG